MGKRMHYQPWVGLPNILLRDFAVPELLQGDATPGEARRGGASAGSTTRPRARPCSVRFEALHRELRRDTAQARHRCDRDGPEG